MSTVNLKSSGESGADVAARYRSYHDFFFIAPFVGERAPKKNKKAASHPRAPGGSKVPKTGVASALDAGATEDPFQNEDQDDPSLDAKAPLEEDDDLGSLDPFKFEDQLAEMDAGPSLDAEAPLGEDVDLGSLIPFQYEDPLAETADVGSTLDHIHIRIQQRNGRKTLTTLQGLPKDGMFFCPLSPLAFWFQIITI